MNRNKNINIAETEWHIMELLWKTPMLTIGEIIEGVKKMEWSDSTVKTLVRRLNQKGALGIDSSAGHFRYFTLVSEEECKLKETKNLIDKIYHGSAKLLIASLVSDSNLSESEAEKLMDIIDKME